MAKIKFNSLSFVDLKQEVQAVFMKQFYFLIPKPELARLGRYMISEDALEFPDLSFEKAQRKFMLIIDKYMEQLKSVQTDNKAIYVHSNSKTPLIGTGYIGLVDRNSNIIEIKPQTGCNLNCIFCSVEEGITSKKNDFVVEKDYLIQEIKELIKFKADPDIEAHIGTNGEPLLYSDLVGLVEDLNQIFGIKRISMDTNGTLLTKDKVDKLAQAGMTGFNISINAISPDTAKMLAGLNFNSQHQQEIADYIASLCNQHNIRLNIAPIWVPGFNDNQMDLLAEFVKNLRQKHKTDQVHLAIQNFLEYKGGRTPARQKPWQKFYKELREMEAKHNLKMVYTAEDFGVHPTKKLPKPFKKGDKIKVKIVSPGRTGKEALAVPVENANRAITVIGNHSMDSTKKVEIIRDKHNIFLAK